MTTVGEKIPSKHHALTTNLLIDLSEPSVVDPNQSAPEFWQRNQCSVLMLFQFLH